MDKLTSVGRLKDIISKYEFRFSKSLGQNFLISEHIVNNIIDGAEVTEDDCVLEIGPGIGTMTEVLAERAKKVVAVEIDSTLLPILDETLGRFDNVKVINGDVLKLDIQSIIKEEFGDQKPKLIANLPYYVTTPIIMKFLEENISVSDIVVMIQKEVADRINAVPSTKEYGALSVAVQFYADTSIVAKVPKTVFIPQPNVDSSVIRIKLLDSTRVKLDNPKYFFKTVKAAFGKRRKTLLNALSSGLGLEKDKVNEALSKSGIDPKRRGETLSIEEFGRLSEELDKVRNNQ